MKHRLFIALFVATLAAVCWERHAESNDERAYFVRDGHIYRVEMTGRRFPLVHDPISLVVERTRAATFTMELPRIEGEIEGSEVGPNAGNGRYAGRVVIANGKMTVDLYYVDESARRPLAWNDEYRLVQKENAGTR